MNAVVFDAYGTLFNLDVLPSKVSDIIGNKEIAEQVCAIWRKKQLEYAWRSVLMGRYQDFDKLTELAAKDALTNAQVTYTDVMVADMMNAYLHLPIYDDVKPTLERLEGKFKVAILSNGTFKSLQTLANHNDILFSLDYLLSVEPVRTYKPAREPYQLAVDTLKCEKANIYFVSSNHWDAVGATSFGFETIWCSRKHETPEGIGPQPRHIIHALDELLPRLDA